MPQVLASLPTDRLSLQQENLVGVTALRRLLTGENKCTAAKPMSEPLSAPSLEMLIDDIARGGHGLVMLMGKGGVGKTTLAAASPWRLLTKGLMFI
jgi:arsenite-transporting ATPase